MYYFTLELNKSSSPFTVILEEQIFYAPLTTEIVERIQKTISCITEMLLAPERFQCSFLPIAFSHFYPNTQTFLDIIHCVIEPLLLMKDLPAEDLENLELCQQFLSILKNHTDSSESSPFSQKPTITENIVISDPSTPACLDLETTLEVLESLYGPLPTTCLAIVPQISSPKTTSLTIFAIPQQDIDIENIADTESLASEEDLEPISPLSNIRPLYDPDHLPTTQDPEVVSTLSHSEQPILDQKLLTLPSTSTASRKRAATLSDESPPSKKKQKSKSKRKPKNRSIIKAVYPVGTYSPVSQTTLNPLLKTPAELIESFPDNWRAENQPQHYFATLSLSIHKSKKTTSSKHLKIYNSSHRITKHAWIQYFYTFFRNLTTLINEPINMGKALQFAYLPGYDSSQPLHRLLQALFIVKILEIHLNNFAASQFLIPYIHTQKLKKWKYNLTIALQKYTDCLSSSFYQHNKPFPTTSSPLMKYETVFKLTMNDSNRWTELFISTHDRKIGFINISHCNSYLVPVYEVTKQIIFKERFEKYLEKALKSIKSLIDPENINTHLQIHHPDLVLEKPSFASNTTHNLMQALLFWKIFYLIMEKYWPTKTLLLSKAQLIDMQNLENQCKILLATAADVSHQ